jgi:hypothetical protein
MGLAASMLLSLAAWSCSSGSATPSGSGFCGRFISKVNGCGFTKSAAEAGGDCEEPADSEEICQADCFLGLTCEAYVDLYCRGNISVLGTCITKCEPPPFFCGSGEQIPANDRCDGFEQCSDASDEAGCPTFACADGSTIPLDDQCDGFPHCPDSSDENGCPGAPPPFDCGDGSQVPGSFRCDGFDDCPNAADEANCPPEPPDPLEADCAALGVPRGP